METASTESGDRDRRFETRVVQQVDGIVIYVSGEVDLAACQRLRDVIEPNLGPQQSIILDMSDVEFMDSSSLRFLVQARGALTGDGGSLTLRNPSVAAHRLLTLAGAEALLDDDSGREASSPIVPKRSGGSTDRS